MRAVIHIGHGKTGTTTTQATFSNNDALLLDHGVLYPKSLRQRTAHHPLAWVGENKDKPDWAWIDRRSNEDLAESLETELSQNQAEVLVVSSEVLFQMAAPEALVEFFSRWVKRFDVVANLRRQDSLLESRYSQGIKTGRTNLSETEFMQRVLDTGSMDFSRLLEPWWSAVGQDHVHLATMEPGHKGTNPLNVITDRIEHMPELEEVPSRNTRMARDAIEFLRALPHERRTSEPFRDLNKGLVAWSARRDDPPGWDHFYTFEQRRDFLKKFDQSNAEVAAVMGRSTLFEGGPDQSDESYPGITVERVAELARFVWGRAAGVGPVEASG